MRDIKSERNFKEFEIAKSINREEFKKLTSKIDTKL